jgi:hypothetical protein
MSSDGRRPPRLRPISPGTIADNVRASEGVSDEELVARLYVAFGFGEGAGGVAEELGLSDEDADALTRNALQLLRGALGDLDLDDPVFYGRLQRRSGHRTARPDSTDT